MSLFPSPTVAIGALSGAQLQAWRACAEAAVVPNPFYEPDCQLPAVEHLADGLDARLLVAPGGDDLLACLPLCTKVSRLGPFRRRVAHSRALDASIGLGVPLIATTSLEEGAAGLLASMRRWAGQGGPGIVVLDWIDDDGGGVGEAIRAVCASERLPCCRHEQWERPVLWRSEAGLSLEATMSKERRRQLDRRRRRLGEALGGDVELVDRGGDVGAVEEFLTLEASGWKGEQGGAYAARPDAEAWFRAACASFAASGRLHLLSLQVGGQCVAIQCGLRAGRSVFFFRVGHDDALSRYAPGVLVQLAGVEDLGESGAIDLVDSCADPGNAFLSDLYPDRRRMARLVIGTGGVADRLAVAALDAARRRRATGEASDGAGPAPRARTR